MITNTQSVSETTTFGASVSDPFGIVSASIEFLIEKPAGQSWTCMYTPPGDVCSRVSWTPFFNCVSGTITGCDGGDQTGEFCTAKRLSTEQLDAGGIYLFVQTNS